MFNRDRYFVSLYKIEINNILFINNFIDFHLNNFLYFLALTYK